MKQTALLSLGVPLLIGAFEGLFYDPPQTPDTWCQNQPCIKIWGIILCQPTSTLLVFFVAFFTIYVGIVFLRRNNNQLSRFWMGISLLLWGVGAGLAGTSYQAFGYEIKCAGRDFCVWTSWWEIVYMICTVVGAGTLLISIIYTSKGRHQIDISKGIALAIGICYTGIVIMGAIISNRFLLSFEFMLIFLLPLYSLILIILIQQYWNNRERRFLELLRSGLLLFIALGIYYVYSLLGFTTILWARGIWFSDNDVLHILMIVWVFYLNRVLGKSLKDSPEFGSTKEKQE